MKFICHLWAAIICIISSSSVLAVYKLTVNNEHNHYTMRVFFHSTGAGDRTVEVGPGQTVTVEGGKTAFFSSCYDRIEATVRIAQPDGTFRDGATFIYTIGINQCTDHSVQFFSSLTISFADPDGKVYTTPGQLGMKYGSNSKALTLPEALTPGARYKF